MARRKQDKKRHGKSNIATDASRRSSRRKRCRSSKKLARKLRRQKSRCGVCEKASGGKRHLFDCGHVIHRRCVKSRLKYPNRTCPTCREELRASRYPHLIGADGKLKSIEAFLAEMTSVKIPKPLTPLHHVRNVDDSSSDVDSRNMYLDNQSPHLVGITLSDLSRLIDDIANLDDSLCYLNDPSSNFDPYSRNDSADPSSNFDHPTADSLDPTSGLDIPTTEVPSPSLVLDNPPSDLDNSRVKFSIAELGRDLLLSFQQSLNGLPPFHEALSSHEHELTANDPSDDELIVVD